MTPPHLRVGPASARRKYRILGLTTFLLLLTIAQPALALKVVTWNLLRYPTSDGDIREDDYRVVLNNLLPDVMVVQEISSTAGPNEFLTDVFNIIEPGQWALAPFVDGNDTDSACYYRTSKVDFISDVTIQTTPVGIRDIRGWRFRPDGYSTSDSEFSVYSCHLKAGSSSSDEDQRAAEAADARDHFQTLDVNHPFLFGGDYNVKNSFEPAYIELTGGQANNNGQLFDPINRPGSWNNTSFFADIHTQSTRQSQTSPGGASTGGMDDRFDFLLANNDMLNGVGIDYVPGSYVAYGQDGLHFNLDVNDPPTNAAVGQTIANALWNASDHLPVALELQLPALLFVAGNLDFGDVILGTAASRALLVQNLASPPAEDLSYSLSPLSGFTVPAGTLIVAPGALDSPLVSLNTAAPGMFSGTITVSSNAPDSPSVNIAASGTVLLPSLPSLESGSVVQGSMVDFGEAEIGAFSPQPVDVYNVGFNPFQSQLEVYEVQVTGADAARFSVPAFAPALVGGVPANFSIEFDDTGAVANTTYAATLTLKTRDDQNVLGALDRPDIVLGVEATVADDVTDTPATGVARTRLFANQPNPFNPATMLRFEIAQEGAVSLAIYSVQGRRVRTLVDTVLAAGRYERRWDGRDDQGRDLSSGVYFYRLISGDDELTRRMTLVR